MVAIYVLQTMMRFRTKELACNVTATIEVITEENGKEIILATSTDVKLQLIRPSLTNFQGQEVLYQSMKTCTQVVVVEAMMLL